MPVVLGEMHEQICDPAFDAGRMRERAGGGSHGHASQDRDKQQWGNGKEQEENPKEPCHQRSPVFQSGVAASNV
jgi:hypothetical protein